MSYLTKDDEKRFLNLYPNNGMIMPHIFDELLMIKGTKKEVNKKMLEQVIEELNQLDNVPFVLTQIPPTLAIIKGKGLCYDSNILVSRICDIFYTSIFKKNAIHDYKLPKVARLYYNGQMQEYLDRMHQILLDVKEKITMVINQEQYFTIVHLTEEQLQQLRKDRKTLTWVIRNLEKIVDIYSAPLSDDIKSHFSQDKLIMFLGHLSISEIVESLASNEEINYEHVRFIQAVVAYINYRRKNGEMYNPTYKFLEPTGEQHIISAESLLIQHKQFIECIDHYEKEPFEEQDLLHILSDLKRKIRLEEFKKSISIGWEILPEKETEEKVLKEKIRRKNSFKTEAELMEEETKKEQLLEEKTSLFASLPYVTNLKGKNHFEGYEAYVFENGKVILEKFYKKTRNGYVPVINEAIYAMNIQDFEELSKMGKTELREYAKENGLDVKPIYHTKYFSKRVMSFINSTSYNNDVLDYIDQLIEKSKSPLEKRK